MANKYLEKIAGVSPVTSKILRTAAAGSAIGGSLGATSAESGSRTSGALKGAAIGGTVGLGIGSGAALGRASKIRMGLGNLTPGSKSSLVPAGVNVAGAKVVNPKVLPKK